MCMTSLLFEKPLTTLIVGVAYILVIYDNMFTV